MTANRLAVWAIAAALTAVSTPALACRVTPVELRPMTGEEGRSRQAELWTRSDVVFLSRAGDFAPVDLGVPGVHGNRATLTPSLALKGESPQGGIDIRHTMYTSCGPIPFLPALRGAEGDWFVTYARDLPSGLSIDATIPVEDLIDTEALRAWRKGYEPKASVSEN